MQCCGAKSSPQFRSTLNPNLILLIYQTTFDRIYCAFLILVFVSTSYPWTNVSSSIMTRLGICVVCNFTFSQWSTLQFPFLQNGTMLTFTRSKFIVLVKLVSHEAYEILASSVNFLTEHNVPNFSCVRIPAFLSSSMSSCPSPKRLYYS